MRSISQTAGPVAVALWLLACSESQRPASSLLEAGPDDAGRESDTDLEPSPDAGDDELDAAEADAGPAQTFVTIRFKGKVGEEDYACGESYPAQGATELTARGRDFRFFVHDVRLIDAAGEEVTLALEARGPAQSEALAMIDFNNARGECASFGDATNTIVTGHVPPGQYRGIALAIGVPEDLNHGDPARAAAPLRGSGMAWNWVQGYRFLVAELEAVELADAGTSEAGQDAGSGDAATSDAGSDAQEGMEPGLGVVHLGSTGCVGSPARGISCAKQNRAQVRLPDFDPETDSIVADLGALFTAVDLAQGAQCHARGDECEPMFTALGVNLESGGVLESQTFLRVE
jgi:uncharacterized repeat protein (TIGR04052 family)